MRILTSNHIRVRLSLPDLPPLEAAASAAYPEATADALGRALAAGFGLPSRGSLVAVLGAGPFLGTFSPELFSLALGVPARPGSPAADRLVQALAPLSRP